MTDRELFEAYRSEIYRVCYALVGQKADAEDLCQETFIRAFRSDRSGIDSLKPWLMRIAVNLCRSQLKRKAQGGWKEKVAHLLGVAACRDEAVEDTVERRANRREMAAFLGKLSHKQRSVLTLRYYGEMTVPEIAETLRIPEGTVKSRLNKGHRELRSMLQDNGGSLWKGEECYE
ncbi:RNA polymerase sigma-70 factor (ECF subfamily) [Paenibacillus mucilaginosus]|uniref:RNA polymerase sigma factor n=1 Tax=Paenibacillus mucilaginosus TaxID=61624 RepID=UPI003D1A56F0